MKNIFKVLVILFITLISCSEEILNKQPLDIISDAQVWKDPKLIDDYFTSTYQQTWILLNEMPVENGQTGFEPFIINVIGDECFSRWGTVPLATAKLGNLKINGGLLEWWEQSYKVIRMLNEFIQKVPSSPLDENLKKTRVAEARFLRAYNYFAMVKRYGGVPLIKEPQKLGDSKESLYPSRNTEKEVYDFVLAEMDAIYKDLPVSYTGVNLGRPTKYAALTLKSRAALYAGSIARFGSIQLDGLLGINAAQASNYYQSAYDAAKIIISDGVHSLYNRDPDKVKNFKNIFLVENNEEVIFSRIHDYTDYNKLGNGWDIDWVQAPFPNSIGNGNASNPYLEMAEEFEHVDGTPGKLDRTAIQQGLWTADELWAKKDPRFYASIYTYGKPWKGTFLDFHRGLRLPDGTIQTSGSYQGILADGNQVSSKKYGTNFGVLKYLEEGKNILGDMASSGTDWIIFRYAEVLLNFAEAAFELGKTDEALNAVNQIRNRAGIAPLVSVSRIAIQHERKIELFCEGHHYWDVRRWRTAVVDLSKSLSGIQYILDVATGKLKISVIANIDGKVTPPKFFEYNYYFPITLNRTAQNPNLVENPGYK